MSVRNLVIYRELVLFIGIVTLFVVVDFACLLPLYQSLGLCQIEVKDMKNFNMYSKKQKKSVFFCTFACLKENKTHGTRTVKHSKTDD